jgi:hypothetical protein
MIRNPAAFVSSIKRLDWRFDFRNWLDQDLLMRDLLDPFSAEIHRMIQREHDVIDQAILQWRVYYHVVDGFRRAFPHWHFVHWEHLAQDPIHQFRRLYEALGLTFTDEVARLVERDTRPGNTRQVASHEPGTIRRDSRAVAAAWRTRLDPGDFARVRDGVGDLAARYYRPEEWAYPEESDGAGGA